MDETRTHITTRGYVFMAILITASVPIGLMFTMKLFNASIIWPSTAFAFAFLFLWGRRVALPVFGFVILGYLLGYITVRDYSFGMSVLMALTLGTGDFAASLFGAWLARRLKVMLALNLKDVVLALATAFAMALVAAIIGNLGLLLIGTLTLVGFWESLLIWFLGDVSGVFIFGLPLVMALQVDRTPLFSDFTWKEGLFYTVTALFAFFLFRGDLQNISFVFHKYLFIPFAIVMAFYLPVRSVYIFSLLFLILMYVTEPFFIEPNIFIYMSEVNFLLIILTAIAVTLKLVIMKIESSKSAQMVRQRRLNTLVDALQELFSFSKDASLLENGLEHEASRVFRLIARIIGNIDYGSCAVIEGDKVRFIDAIGFDVDALNRHDVSADDWIKDLERPRRFKAKEQIFKPDTGDGSKVSKAFEDDLLKRVKESVFMSVKLSETMACELSFDIDKDSKAAFDDETMAYFEGLNILLNTFFEASQMNLDPSRQTNSMVVALLRAIDLFDPDTRMHSERVASIAWTLAKMYGLNEYSANTLFWAGIVHDIGKIGLEGSLLDKKGPLTVREYEIMKTHPRRGHDLLIQSSTLENIAEYVLHHHERYDGAGYPDKLMKGENLKESSILAVAEAIAAMHEDRPYSGSLDADAIIAELRTQAGHQFDPEVASLAVEAIREGLLENPDKENQSR